MKIKTNELIDLPLNWAVGMAQGYELSLYGVGSIRARVPGLGVHAPWHPTFSWDQAGPILDGHISEIYKHGALQCIAAKSNAGDLRYGPTKRVAFLRAFVASKLGDEVEIPDALCKDEVTP